MKRVVDEYGCFFCRTKQNLTQVADFHVCHDCIMKMAATEVGVL